MFLVKNSLPGHPHSSLRVPVLFCASAVSCIGANLCGVMDTSGQARACRGGFGRTASISGNDGESFGPTRDKWSVGAFGNCGSGVFKLTWVDKMVASKRVSFEGLISCVWEREQKDIVSVETSLNANQLY